MKRIEQEPCTGKWF